MDVHRARFVPYPTSAISALAFSRSSDNNYIGSLPALKLALGRANGDIEVWNPQRGLWVQETVFSGNNASIDGLAWTQDPDERDADGHTFPGQHRLFSIASSPSVTEWDLATGQAKRQSTGNFSEVWCLAAQPRLPPRAKDSKDVEVPAQELIAGCGDGTIVLLSTSDDDLQFKKFLARVAGKKARCMCITYQNRDRVIAGFADSNIRIFDTRNGAMVRSMSLGISIPGAPKSALVWQVRCLPNGDIVSGDSNGEVKFWDGRTYSMLQRITAHDSDCLEVATSNDGKTVFSGSIDGKIAVYRQTVGDHGQKSWSKNGHRRVHSGEVKAMAAFDSKAMSVVVSGGADATPMLTPLREYSKENLRSLPSLPHGSPVASARKARLLVSWWEKSVLVWRIAKHSSLEGTNAAGPQKLVARINLDTKSAIRDVAISSDGRALAVSTGTEVKVFQLQRRIESESLAVRKLELPKDVGTSGARIVRFSDDGKWLASISLENEVYVARLVSETERPKYIKVLSKAVELDRRHRTADKSAFKEYERTINQVAFAADSSVLAVSDLAGYIDSWVLEGHEDITAAAMDVTQNQSDADSSAADSDSDSSSDSSDDDATTTIFYGQHWTDNPASHLLPKLDSPALILSFRPQQQTATLTNGNPGVHSTRNNPHAHAHTLPTGQHNLFILTSKHQILEFDLLAGRLTDWSRRNPSAALPEEFTQIRDRVMGAVWDVSERRERVWLYGNSFTCVLDVSKDLEGRESVSTGRKRRKTKGGEDEEQGGRKRVKVASGAGSRIAMVGDRQEVGRRFEGGVEVAMIEQDKTDADEDDVDEEIDFRLARLPSEGEQEMVVNGVDGETEEKRWWCTFKYRPILGMVPLGDDADRQEGEALEVVIVERPLWDARESAK